MKREIGRGPPVTALENIHLSFGGLRALQDVSVAVQPRERLAIIGPNGAGKSSLFNIISGIYTASSGVVRHKGEERPSRMKPYEVARLGIARTFQNIALFPGMSALDNIMTGRNSLMRRGILSEALQLGWARRQEIEHRRRAEEIIDFLEIPSVRRTPVGALPYGMQKRVELGRALAAEPELLLLDEPMAGMNLEEKEDMCRFILDVNEIQGTTLILVEHDMGVVMDISDRVAVFDYGRKIADAAPDDVRRDQTVIDAYLGTAHEH